MRWLFADRNNPQEVEYVRRTTAAIDRWWQAFQSKIGDLTALFRRRSEWNLPQFMEDHLQAIHPRLMWEYGPAVKGDGHRLVITPEAQHWLRPVVKTTLERAPKISGWEFYAHRLPENHQQVVDHVQARVGVDISGALIEAHAAPGRKVNLSYAFPNCRGANEQKSMSAALVATETLLGEQTLDAWIGVIGLADGPTKRLLPLARAQATVSAVIRSIQDQLPATCSTDIRLEEGWKSVQLTPDGEADDYVGRSDLIAASTHDADFFQAAHNGYLFDSRCHSKIGEAFCYLKIDAVQIARGETVEFRAQFEDALNPALVAENVGGCIGGGSGLRYSYIDLALTKVAAAIPIIRRVLAELRAPVRTWLLFHDSHLAAEWVGLYAQTPPPPQAQ